MLPFIRIYFLKVAEQHITFLHFYFRGCLVLIDVLPSWMHMVYQTLLFTCQQELLLGGRKGGVHTPAKPPSHSG